MRAVEKICEVLGMVIPTANPSESEGGNFIRVRVAALIMTIRITKFG